MKFYPNLNLNQRNQQDATPLHLAIIYDNLDIIRCLIQFGADRSLTMKNKTCLQISTEFNYEDLIEFFSKLV
jgi:ankyrin repeat protein